MYNRTKHSQYPKKFREDEKGNSHYGTETEGFQESVIGRVGKARPKNAVVDHGEVERRHEYLLGVVVGGGGVGGGEGNLAVGGVELHGGFGGKIAIQRILSLVAVQDLSIVTVG